MLSVTCSAGDVKEPTHMSKRVGDVVRSHPVEELETAMKLSAICVLYKFINTLAEKRVKLQETILW